VKNFLEEFGLVILIVAISSALFGYFLYMGSIPYLEREGYSQETVTIVQKEAIPGDKATSYFMHSEHGELYKVLHIDDFAKVREGFSYQIIISERGYVVDIQPIEETSK